MAVTRSKTLKQRRRTMYRNRVKRSHCRGKGSAVCRRTKGCKTANGSKRRFCRKLKNRHTFKM